MNEFVPLSVTGLLEPALIGLGFVLAGAVLIILLEAALLLAVRLGSRVAAKLHERQARL